MDIRESIQQIFASGTKLADRFYKIFLERCPQASPYFQGTNMEAQSQMLTVALGAVRQHPEIKNGFKSYLRLLGTRHKGKNIPRELYGDFFDALLAALEEFHDSGWNDALAQQWRDAFRDVEVLMLEGYDEEFRELPPAADAVGEPGPGT